MKFLPFTIIVILAICHSSVGEAIQAERMIIRGQCPEKWTQEECEAYAKRKTERKDDCAIYEVSNGEIVWHSCGVKFCKDEASGNEYRATEKDLTKNYPDCCPKCATKSIAE